MPVEVLTKLNDLVVAALVLVGPLPDGLFNAVVQQLGSSAGAAAALPFWAFLEQGCTAANVHRCRAVLAVMMPSLPWPWLAHALDG